jgi:hypothetical protein
MKIITDEELKSICYGKNGTYLRPFRPHAFWRSTQCFLVGEWPKTDMTTSFDCFEDYWQSLTCKASDFELKLALRTRAAPSRARQRLSSLSEAIGAQACLITNLCWYPARRYCAPPINERRQASKNLQILLRACRPKVLFFHGAGAVSEAEAIFGIQLDRFLPPELQNVCAGGIRIFAYHHLSAPGRNEQETEQDLQRFGEIISEILLK